MIPVKTLQRYKCDFCKKRSTKSVIEKHEKRCFRNPNRFCDYCNNKGKIHVVENGYGYHENCPYCSKFDPKVLKEIQEYEKKYVTTKETESTEVPF